MVNYLNTTSTTNKKQQERSSKKLYTEIFFYQQIFLESIYNYQIGKAQKLPEMQIVGEPKYFQKFLKIKIE